MIDTFERAALSAGQAIEEICRAGVHVSIKADCTPVTEADRQAEAIILEILAQAMPECPVVAEESVAAGNIPDIDGRTFILVDPLDGTKEFVERRADYTVNIALIENGVPVAGIVHAPAKGLAYTGIGGRAERLTIGPDFSVITRTPITVRTPTKPPFAVASRSHSNAETEEFLVRSGITEHCSIGSSLKFCLLADGTADVYPRFSRTMEWDTAAGDAVLRAAGGRALTLDGKPLRYGKRNQESDVDFANPSFIAWGGTEA